MFLELMRWAEGGTCRHDAILRYFGDEAETLAGCGRCDNCTALDEPGNDDAVRTATIVRKALSAVARTHRKFGLQATVKLLAGASDPRLERSGLATTKTFGALRGKPEDWLLALLRRCVTAGWIDFTPEERPLVLLTASGRAVLFAEGPVRFLLPPEHSGRVAARTPTTGARKRQQAVVTANPQDTALFDALRARRLELARAEGMPPYVVASDRTLRELAEVRPRSIEQLQGIHGIGPAKAARYGEALLDVVRAAR
jgi:ATP-dependent DNA helicase RecQ